MVVDAFKLQQRPNLPRGGPYKQIIEDVSASSLSGRKMGRVVCNERCTQVVPNLVDIASKIRCAEGRLNAKINIHIPRFVQKGFDRDRTGIHGWYTMTGHDD